MSAEPKTTSTSSHGNGADPSRTTQIESPERFDPLGQTGELIDAEHRGRYWWAAQTVAGKDVLDAGCGVGYGVEILSAGGAGTVTGVDLDEGAVAEARRRCGTAAEAVVHGDLRDLSLPSESFDVVVCFETIEHMEEGERALEELHRVLRPDGLLLVSSPNPDVYPPGNEHHLHEYRPAELAAVIGERFDNVVGYRQHPWLASAIEPASARSVSPRRRETRVTKKLPSGGETFSIFAASDGELPELDDLVVLGNDFEVGWWSGQLQGAERRAEEARVEAESRAEERIADAETSEQKARERIEEAEREARERIEEIERGAREKIEEAKSAELEAREQLKKSEQGAREQIEEIERGAREKVEEAKSAELEARAQMEKAEREARKRIEEIERGAREQIEEAKAAEHGARTQIEKAEQGARDSIEEIELAAREQIEEAKAAELEARAQVEQAQQEVQEAEQELQEAERELQEAEQEVRERVEAVEGQARERVAVVEARAEGAVQAAESLALEQVKSVEAGIEVAEQEARELLSRKEQEFRRAVARAEESERGARARLQETSAALLDANQSLAQIPLITHRLRELEDHCRGLQGHVGLLEGSRSWRFAAPLRWLRNAFRLRR